MIRPFAAIFLLLCTITSAIQLPNLQSFVAALSLSSEAYIPAFSGNASEAENQELLKRQFGNGCPDDFRNCGNLGAPGLCCASAAVCSPDAAGNVACCPSGLACAGTVTGYITGGTVNTVGSLVSGPGAVGGVVAGATTTSSFVYAGSTTTQGGYYPSTTTTKTNNNFIIVASSTTVATPGAGLKRAEIPFPAELLMRALEYLPI